MGQYTKLLQLNSSELPPLKREDLYSRFHTQDWESNGDVIDIDKSKEGIIFLLTGKSFSLGSNETFDNLFNGTSIDFPDNGDLGLVYRVLIPEEVKKIDQLFREVNYSDLQKNFDPLVMMASNVYPDIWNNGKESYDYLYTHFVGLKKFISKAAHDSKALVILTS